MNRWLSFIALLGLAQGSLADTETHPDANLPQASAECTIALDETALGRGALHVQFHHSGRIGPNQHGCWAQGLGGALVVLSRDGNVVATATTGPVSYLSGPSFTQVLPFRDRLRQAGTYTVYAQQGGWTSNTIEFERN